MLEKLKVEAVRSAREAQINTLASVFSSLFCYLFTKLFLALEYPSVSSVTSLGISIYGILAFYHVLSFYELKNKRALAKVVIWMMYFGIFFLFLIILSQLADFSELVKANRRVAIPSLIVGVPFILIPRFLWSTLKKIQMPMSLVLPLNLTILYSLIEKIKVSEMLQVIVALNQLATKLGLSPTQSNLFVLSVLIGLFYILIKFLEVVIKWILFISILGLVISVVAGIF